VCTERDSPFTVEHILIDCIEFAMSISKFLNISSLEKLFDTVQARDLIDFVKEIGLYYKL
jgi:hypothetical protein